MNVDDAIQQACDAVGIKPPKVYRPGQWAKADTLSGKSGKGDGRIIVDEARVTAHNWQTGENTTVWLNGEMTQIDRRQMARRIERDNQERRERAARAAHVAGQIAAAAKLSTHAYLAAKGFRGEKAFVIGADAVRSIAGAYLVPEGGAKAIIMPARIGPRITSIQLIWENGAKKFLAGGEISGSCHRIGKGSDTWLCEGYATGLSLRAALKSLNRSDTILCCFSASNVAAVARSVKGRCFIAADHDKPMEQFDGLGTGEHWARVAGKPYTMPPEQGDINDMHMSAGIFAVQRLIADLIRRAR